MVALGAVDALGHQPAVINDHVGSLRALHITLEERRRKVLEGPAGKERRNCGVLPFKNMSKEGLIRECKGRHLSVDGLLKPASESNLKEVLRGIQRVPALCFPQQECSLQELSLGNYEV